MTKKWKIKVFVAKNIISLIIIGGFVKMERAFILEMKKKTLFRGKRTLITLFVEQCLCVTTI